MHPAPTRIAATPRPKSEPCWNPAVPPPPVSGAAVGIAVVEGLADADGLADGLVLGAAVGLAEELVLGVADGLEELDETLADADADTPGDSFGSVALGADPEQAAIDTEASTLTITQPAAVSLAPNPVRAVAARIVTGPPRTPGRWRDRFAVPASQPASEGNRGPAQSPSASAEQQVREVPTAIKGESDL